MFKANPAVWDVHGALRDGQDIDRWRMVDSYRVGLVAPGQPCVLWVTRSGTVDHPSGIYAVGEIAGEPYLDIGDGEDGRWGDVGDARAERPYVEVRLDVLERPVESSELRADPAWEDEEIFRAPRVASPVAVSPEAWHALSSR